MGKHLTSHLLQTGKHTVTAITRPDSTSKMPDGVHIARVDYINDKDDDDAALVDVLRGHQALIITMSIAAPRGSASELFWEFFSALYSWFKRLLKGAYSGTRTLETS